MHVLKHPLYRHVTSKSVQENVTPTPHPLIFGVSILVVRKYLQYDYTTNIPLIDVAVSNVI